jgi:hypothetical protein
MVWVYIIVFIISLIVSIALSPRPQKPKAAALEDFDVPVAEEDREVGVLFGTQKLTAPNVCWYGDLRVKAIRKRSGFSKATVGYKYYMTFHMIFCHVFDRVHRLEIGEKVAWSGGATSNTTIAIDQPDLFGGEKREGGISMNVEFMFGAPDQTANATLSASTGRPQPAYRGVAGLVASGYIGTTAYPKPWAPVATRVLKGWMNDDPWYPGRAAVDGVKADEPGMNPAHIIYQCLTDIEWGQGSPIEMIDDANFRTAADTLWDERLGLNLYWARSTTIEDFCGLVLDHIAGILAFNHLTNKYVLRLVRGDYDPDDLDEFGPGEIRSEVRFQRRTWGETVNELTVTHTDATTFKSTGIIVQDLGNIRAQQQRIGDKIDLAGISHPDVIKVVGGRELLARSTPLATFDFTVNRKFWQHGQGSVCRITWPRRNLDRVVFRILSVKGGTLESGTITVSAVEDIYALQGAVYTTTPAQPPTVTEPVTPEDLPEGGNVISATISDPPSNPSNGDSYIVPEGSDWGGVAEPGQLVIWDEDNQEWIVQDIPDGTIIYVEDTNSYVSITSGTIRPGPWTPAIASLTEDTVPDLANDFLVTYKPDAGQYRKVKANNVGGGGGGSSDPVVSQIVAGLGPLSPDTPPIDAADPDDEFEMPFELDTAGARRADASEWIWRNQDATTAVVNGGLLILICPADGARELHGVEQTAVADSGGTWRYRTKLAVKHSGGNTQMGGLYVGESAGGKLLSLSWGYTGGALTLQADRWTDATTHSSAQGASTSIDELHDAMDWLYLGVEFDGTDINFSYSKTGADETFVLFYSEAAATHLGTDPDRVGIWGASSNAGQSTIVVADWFRWVPADGFRYPPSVVQLQTRTLAETVLSFNPTAYWQLNDAGPTFADSSGNGWTLSVSGTINFNYSVLVPSEPNTKYAYIPTGANYASRSGAGAIGSPLNGDWTVMAISCPLEVGSVQTVCFAMSGVGESEAVNCQVMLRLTDAGELSIFWEHGGGIDDTVNSGIFPAEGAAYLFAAVKDGTAETITFYINGLKVGVVTYSNEPTGGSNVSIGVGDVGTLGNTATQILGHVAFFNGTKLTGGQIALIARAAGLFGPPYVLPSAPSLPGQSDIQAFTTPGSDTWVKPANCSGVTVICIGGGGGGGGGRKQATGQTRPGGGGGGGGGFSTMNFAAIELGDTETVTVGAGGAGGAGAIADTSNGSSGTAGGDSSFGALLRATGGGAGNGATSSSATTPGGAAGTGLNSDGGAGGTGGSTTTGTVGGTTRYGGGGGGGGPGVSNANNTGGRTNGNQAGGGVTFTAPALVGGDAGDIPGGAGYPGGSTGTAGVPGGGGGGGAGNSNANQSGGNGGAGGLYGGGGGGGAGSTNGSGVAGTGGAGANGIVLVISV